MSLGIGVERPFCTDNYRDICNFQYDMLFLPKPLTSVKTDYLTFVSMFHIHSSHLMGESCLGQTCLPPVVQKSAQMV